MNKFIKSFFLCFTVICFSIVSSFAQQKVLQGKVVSKSDHTGIAHVLIKVEGEDIQGYTNKDGVFNIKVPIKKSYVIKASKLGYVSSTTTVPFESEPLIVLSESMSEIEEVVVNTGYQQLPKERATGSFEVVDNKLYNRQIGTDVISRLDEIMPSVLFDKRGGGEQSMIVRGVGALGLTDSKPLIIVDNFPFEGNINSLNPNDVESITLLKDAAAASIWGAKAGNGVLVITTKKGKFGMGWKLGLTANTMLTEKPDLYYFPQMSSSEFIDVERFLFEKGTFNSVLNNVTSRPPVTPVVELLNKFRNKEISEADLESKLNSYRQIDLRSDMDKYFYRMGINQQYALNLSGGGEKYTSFYSLGYDRNLNTAVGSEFSRISVNLQNTIKPINRLEVSLGFRYGLTSNTTNQIGNLQMNETKGLYPYARLVDDSGNALVVEKDYRVNYLDQVDERGYLLDWRYRPYDELRLADNTNTSNNMLLQSRIKYEVTNGLSAEVNYQYEYQPGADKRFYSEETYYTRNLINRFTQVNGSAILRPVPLGGILDRTPNRMDAHSLRGQLNYDLERDQHSLYVLAGMEARQMENSSNSYRVYGYNPETLNTGIVNYVDRFPIYDNLSGASTIHYVNNESSSLNRFVSYFSNASYSYDNRYTISGSIRRDASNLFGVDTNNKWTPLWSIGGLWNIAGEQFYDLAFLPVLKLRSTMGYSGNISTSQSAVTTIEYRGNSRIGRFPFAIVKNPPNPSLRWEKVGTFNLGLDFVFQGGMFSGSLEFYKKTSEDLITTVDADPTIGFTSLVLNSAVVRNSGMDLSVQYKHVKGVLDWTSNFMLSINKNKVVDYFRSAGRVSQWVGGGVNISPIVGQPTYPVVSYKWGGLDPENGNPIGFVEGVKSTDYADIQQRSTLEDIIFHGSALPEYFGAFRNTLYWNGLSISANITYRAAYYFRRSTINYSTLLSTNTQIGHGDYALRWQNPGDELKTTVPSMMYPTNSRRDEFYRNSEATVEKADHVRLQDINLSYLFSLENSKSVLKNLRISAYVRNVGILWRSNKSNLDPDVRQLPLARIWSFGLTSNF